MSKRKPQNTECFKYHNENPKGLHTSDCVIRAVATATNQSWEKVFKELCELGLEMKMIPNEQKVYIKYIESFGFVKQKQPRKSNNKKFRGYEFVKLLSKDSGPVIANIGSYHIVCIKGMKIHDVWNCSDRCIGSYWIKE